MKTVVIVTHPNGESSLINKRWVEELAKHPDKYLLHDLYSLYPDEKLDIEKEQQLIEAYDTIVFQFPFYWYSSPPLLKKWFDEVLADGWAYGRGSAYKLAGKTIALAITAGSEEKDYQASGRHKYTIKQLTTPFEITFNYIKADYQPLFVFYGTEHHATPERIDQSARDYLSFIDSLTKDAIEERVDFELR